MAAHVETGTMLAPTHYKSQVIKHLGLVAGMVDELGLVRHSAHPGPISGI